MAETRAHPKSKYNKSKARRQQIGPSVSWHKQMT